MSSEAFDLKNAFIVVPVFATSLAICFDVGYFAGIGLTFFSFFSLTEHIVFALQAIPFALPVTVLIMYFIGSGWFIFWYGQRDAVRRQYKITASAILTVVLSVGFGVGLFFYFGWYTASFIMAVAGLLALCINPLVRLLADDRRYVLIVLTVVFAWLAAGLLGYELSERRAASPKQTEKLVLEGKEMPGKLIRGGERGVLFIPSDTKRVIFLRWDAIKNIERL